MYCQWCFNFPHRSIIKSVILKMLSIVIIQVILILFMTSYLPDNIVLISLTLGVSLAISIKLAKHVLRSHLLYNWIVLSMTYTIFVFNFIVVPLAEIETIEHCSLLLFSLISIFFLYLTTTSSNNKAICNGDLEENRNGDVTANGNGCASICPACRVKMHPRNYHCHICQECIPKYDHHSYWLNCCIGEINLHYYVAGIFFGVFALTYASMLILTTICSPEYKFGILLPEDCSDIGDNTEMCTCVICGIYCMELAVILLFKVIYHSYLISRGLTSFEWKEHYRYSLFCASPHSSGFRGNWINFFKKFKKMHF